MSVNSELSALAIESITFLVTARTLDSPYFTVGEKADAGIELVSHLAKRVDAVLSSIADAAGLDHERWSSILSDEVGGNLLFELQQIACAAKEPNDDFREHNTLNHAQQGIGR